MIKTTIAALILFFVAASVHAVTNYIYEVEYVAGTPVSSYTTAATNLPTWFEGAPSRSRGVVTYYRLFATQAEYAGGWASIAAARKAAAKTAAEDDLADFDKNDDRGVQVSAGVVEALRIEVNTLRALHGLPDYNKGQWKQLIRGKTPKPKK